LYEIYAGATGARVTTIQTNQDFRFPTDRLLAAITPQTRLIAIANPNNPTGALVSRADLLRVAKAAPDSAILVDEAYFEFSGETVIDAISEFPNLIVTRTFSKAYGLAGLRVGAIIAEREQTRMIRRVASPYNVNAAALVCVPEALADSEYIRDYVAQATCGRAALERELDCLGIRYWPSRANFVLAYFGEQAQAFVAAMRERGILVRDRERDPGCAGCVRITVGTTEHNERLLRELREVVAGLRSITTAGVSR
jgi:histidinol-phosphate aminotransferase